MSTLQQVAEIIHAVFEDDTTEIDRQTSAHDVEGWDSLSHVNLIVAIESAFGIKFLQKELLTFKNVGDMVDGIDAKIAPL
jgi:acyl carrier protein